jgi:hypothetical protein
VNATIRAPRMKADAMNPRVAGGRERDEGALFTHSRRPDARDLPLTTASVLDTCVSDCAWCGEHNRVVIVTSRGTLSRCLSCRDERVLAEPPSWCHATSVDLQRRAAARRAPAGMASVEVVGT